MKSSAVFILIAVSLCQNEVKGSISADRDLTLTLSEKRSLDKLKTVMDPFLYSDRFKSEAYLIRWLRATRFDVGKAERMLLENFRWRDEFKMDQIHEEDWTDFAKEFPYYSDSQDKESQPVVISRMGEWDFRQVILSGRREKMRRYMFKILDDLDTAIQKQQKNGKLVTRGNILTDVAGYNLAQHACAQCLPLYIELVLAMDKYYPGTFDKMILVNVPSIFEGVLNIMKTAMTPESREALHVFGKNRREWENYLFKYLDKDELPVEFGGHKIYTLRNDY